MSGVTAGTIAMAAATTIGGAVLSKMMAPKAPKAPTVEKPAVMPTPDDDAVRAAKRRSLSGMMNRSGRQSTFLSNDVGSDTLG